MTPYRLLIAIEHALPNWFLVEELNSVHLALGKRSLLLQISHVTQIQIPNIDFSFQVCGPLA